MEKLTRAFYDRDFVPEEGDFVIAADGGYGTLSVRQTAMDLVVGDYRINGMGATDLKAAVALTDDNYGIGFCKEDIALRDKVEELLIEMKKDGTLEKISTQWFGSDITVVPAE